MTIKPFKTMSGVFYRREIAAIKTNFNSVT